MHNEPNIQYESSFPGRTSGVHHVLARSYVVYFLLFLTGICLDILFKPDIFWKQGSNFNYSFVGIILLVLASLLIFWSQRTSRNLDKEKITKESFCKGPYCFTRSPTHWGLFILMLGFGILVNALFVIITTIISFILTKTIFLKKQEHMLSQKYGAPYIEYKKSVRF